MIWVATLVSRKQSPVHVLTRNDSEAAFAPSAPARCRYRYIDRSPGILTTSARPRRMWSVRARLAKWGIRLHAITRALRTSAERRHECRVESFGLRREDCASVRAGGCLRPYHSSTLVPRTHNLERVTTGLQTQDMAHTVSPSHARCEIA